MQKLIHLFLADDAQWGRQLHRAARISAAALVLIAVITADLVVLTYRAGKAFGAALHRRNDQLAALAAAIAAPPAAATPEPVAPAAAPVVAIANAVQITPPHVRMLQEELDRLQGMSQRQLMALAGTRRKLSKRQLVAMLAAA